MEPIRQEGVDSEGLDPRQTRSAADDRFFEYYARESLTAETRRRLTSIRDAVLRVVRMTASERGPLDVVDIGCGPGTLSAIWAASGHRVHGLDVNARCSSWADSEPVKPA